MTSPQVLNDTQPAPMRMRTPEPTPAEYAVLAGVVTAGYTPVLFARLYAHLFPFATAGLIGAAVAAYKLSGADRGRKGGIGRPRRAPVGGVGRAKGPGSAAQHARRAEGRFLAVWIQTAANRIDKAVAAGMPIADAVDRERGNAAARARAEVNRARAARVVDLQASTVGKPSPRGFTEPYVDPVMDPATRPGLGTPTVDSPEVAGGAPLWLEWQADLDEKTSPECRAAHGHVFDARSAPPVIGWPGAVHPHCFPGTVRVSSAAIGGIFRRWYDGEVVEVRTASGHVLTSTPNHPVLTADGWVALGQLREGAHLFRSSDRHRNAAVAAHEHDQAPTLAEVFDTLRMTRGVTAVRMPVAAEDFHGDGAVGEVDVVWSDRFLRGQTEIVSPYGEQDLVRADDPSMFLASLRHAARLRERAMRPASGSVRGEDPRAVLLGSLRGRDERVGVGDRSEGDVVTLQPPGDHGPADVETFGQALDAATGLVFADQIESVRRLPFSGHVYDLSTRDGWYNGNGYIVHNCRCTPGRPSAAAFQRGTVNEAVGHLVSEHRPSSLIGG